MTTLARAPDTHIHRHSRSRRAKEHENGNPLFRMQASTLSHYALAQSRIWQPAQLKDVMMINRHKNNVLDNERKCFLFLFWREKRIEKEKNANKWFTLKSFPRLKEHRIFLRSSSRKKWRHKSSPFLSEAWKSKTSSEFEQSNSAEDLPPPASVHDKTKKPTPKERRKKKQIVLSV